jgi:putative transferase (TIGR04331 family)
MATGIPTILFFDRKNYIFHNDVKKILNDLISCKIIFIDPSLAGKHINRIWQNPLEWFHSDKVRKVRNNFLNLALNKQISISNIQNKNTIFF